MLAMDGITTDVINVQIRNQTALAQA